MADGKDKEKKGIPRIRKLKMKVDEAVARNKKTLKEGKKPKP